MTRGGESKVASKAPHLHFMVRVGDDMVDILYVRGYLLAMFVYDDCSLLLAWHHRRLLMHIDELIYLSITIGHKILKRQLFVEL